MVGSFQRGTTLRHALSFADEPRRDQRADAASPADAKGLLKRAIRGNDPSFFLEASGRGAEMGEVPMGLHNSVRKGSILQEGSDVTIVAIGTMVRHGLAAAKQLSEHGISAEVIDPRTLVPLDETSIVRSVEKTGRLIVVDEARNRCSAASHIAAIAADVAFHALKALSNASRLPTLPCPTRRTRSGISIRMPTRFWRRQ